MRALRSEWRRVRVTGTRATGLELGEAQLHDVTFEGVRLDLASFRNARLERVVFRDCRLEESDFGGARLDSVVFDRCPLVRASLHGCRMTNVELRGCDLEDVQGPEALRGARMPVHDLVANAVTLAAAAGVGTLDA